MARKPNPEEVEKQKADIQAKKDEKQKQREEYRRIKAEQRAEAKRLKAEKKAQDAAAKKEAEKVLPDWIDSGRYDTVEVKVELDQKEKNAAGQELAHKKKQRDQVDLERKQHMSSYKDRLDEITAQMGDLSDKVTLGYEYRKFRCTLHFDFKSKERVYKDADTGKEITRRALQADDYQMRIPL